MEGNQLKEIDLLEIWGIIKKRKRIIISLFFIGLIIGAAWFFIAPSEYIGETVIEIGLIDRISIFNLDEMRKDTLHPFCIEEPVQVSEKINSGIYGNAEGVEAFQVRNTALVQVQLSGRSFEEVKEKLDAVNSSVIESHYKIAEKDNLKVESIIGFLDNKKQEIEQDISYLILIGQQVGILRLEIRKIDLMKDIIKSQIASMPTKIIKGPVIEEKRPSYLIIVISAFLALFLGTILSVFAGLFRPR